jgi:hypothetical protein
MRYLKTYELHSAPGTGNMIDYEVGDTVVCVDDSKKMSMRNFPLVKGKEYKVIKLYQQPEDKYLGNQFLRVDVENTKTGEITKGWESTRFKLEMEFDAGRYNL